LALPVWTIRALNTKVVFLHFDDLFNSEIAL